MPIKRLTFIAILLCLTATPARAYIDMPAERLTLPRLLLEFRTSGVYRIERFAPDTGAIRFELVETLQGTPAPFQKHILRMGGKIPAELKGIAVGGQVLLMGADPYGRGLAFINGAWYVTNYEREIGWWRIAYTSAYFDFRCAFASDDLPLLVRSCKTLLDGEGAIVPCHRKPKSAEIQFCRVSLREPHKRIEVPTPASREEGANKEFIGARPARDPIADLGRPEPIDRIRAAKALGMLGESSAQSVPALVQSLQMDKDPFVRRQCAMALGRLGASAESAIPALLDRFSHGYENAINLAGCEAVAAIRRIDPNGAKFLTEIRLRMQSRDPAIRRKAIDAIGLLGPPAREEILTILIAAIADRGAEVRYAAARALDWIEAPAASAAPALAPLLADKDQDVPDAARTTLLKMGAGGVTEIAKMLAPTRELKARRRAVRLLHDLGSQAAAAKEALVSARKDADDEVRAMAEKALARLTTLN